MSRHSPDMNVMIKAAEKASRSLNRDFGEVENLQVSQKGPGDFVSAADKQAEKIIREELQYARPDYPLLLEESGLIEASDTDHRWIVDPLDGTTNFLHGIPHWAISIALESHGEIVAGLVYDPIKDEMFTAEKGQGAFLRRSRLRVSARQDLMMSTIATGAPRRALKKQEQFLGEYKAVLNVAPGLRRFGAAALDLAYVAAGRCEAFWERDLKAWDIAAGILLVKEAGGFVSSIDDESVSPLDSGDVVAGNTYIYEDLKTLLQKV
jgi:myo-inositol-1(or 4)-monophosphatase